MAYQVLSMSDEDAAALGFGHPERTHQAPPLAASARTTPRAEICPICASAKRDTSVICVVETPRDVQAFERTREYHGLYHVLHGLISPMDGIGAEQLSVKELLARLGDGKGQGSDHGHEPHRRGGRQPPCIWPSSSSRWASRPPRLAYGLPVGASLEYTDETTLYRALSGRGEL